MRTIFRLVLVVVLWSTTTVLGFILGWFAALLALSVLVGSCIFNGEADAACAGGAGFGAIFYGGLPGIALGAIAGVFVVLRAARDW